MIVCLVDRKPRRYTAIRAEIVSEGQKMSSLRWTACGVIWGFALFAAVAVPALGATAEPATTQSTARTFSPPTQSTPLGTTFVDWDTLPVRATAAGESRAIFDNPTPTLEK